MECVVWSSINYYACDAARMSVYFALHKLIIFYLSSTFYFYNLKGKIEDTDGSPEDMSLKDLTYLKNCPVTPVDIERSFIVFLDGPLCTKIYLLPIDVHSSSKISKSL